MVVGVLQFDILIHDAQSLKDKRRVVRSIKDRLHRDHQVAVAEVDALDNPALARLALSCVAREGHRAGEILDRIAQSLRSRTDGELGRVARQIMPFAPQEPHNDPIDRDALARELLDTVDTDTTRSDLAP